MHVPSHQLPDQRQGVHWTPLVQVLSPDADQGEVSDIPAQLNSVVTVLQLARVKKKRHIPLDCPLKRFCAHQLSITLTRVHGARTFFILAPRTG